MNPSETDIATRFERQVTAASGSPAVGSLTDYTSYGDLNRAANRLAHLVLAQAGGAPGPVGVLMGRENTASIVSALAVLKAGGVVVPLDYRAPVRRSRSLLRQVSPRIILTDDLGIRLATSCAPEGCAVMVAAETSRDLPETNPRIPVAPGALSGIYFTSGSTGEPKGVLQTHRNLIHSAGNHVRSLGITNADRLSLLSPAHTIASCSATFGALLHGACVFPFDVRMRGFGAMADWMKRKKITVLHCVPTLLRRFCRSLEPGMRFPNVRLVKLGGEPVDRGDTELVARHFGRGCVLVNGLGMTEANGNVAHFHVPPGRAGEAGGVPVGFPLDGFKVTVEGSRGEALPPGKTGEIVVESEFLSPGYIDESGTAAFGLPEPGGGAAPRRYRTGDLAWIRDDGALVHAGRSDARVKVRGNRVSLDEVELELRAHPSVAEAAVVAVGPGGEGVGGSPGGTSIVAYVVPAAGSGDIPPARLREFLVKRLPEAAVPAGFVSLPSLPVTPTGKVDRARLAQLGAVRSRSKAAALTPSGEADTTARVVAIWCGLLPEQDLHASSDFFAAGGDSLAALAMLAEVESTFDVEVAVADFAVDPTVGHLVSLIERPEQHDGANGVARVVTLRSGEPGARPLFVVPPAGSDASRLLPLAARWGAERPFCVFSWKGIDGRHVPHGSIGEMAEYFLEAMRQVQPAGPYDLCGTSFGGLVAHEMARRLRESGEGVARLVVVDTRLPGWLRKCGRVSVPGAWRRFLYRHNPVGGRRTPTWAGLVNGLGQRKRIRIATRSAEARLHHGLPVLHTDRHAFLLGVALAAARRHRVHPYDGDVLLLRTVPDAPRELFTADPTLGWGEFVRGRLTVDEIPGFHGEILIEPNVAAVADHLRGSERGDGAGAAERAESGQRPALAGEAVQFG